MSIVIIASIHHIAVHCMLFISWMKHPLLFNGYFNGRMQIGTAVSAAHILHQSAEAVLPKQKRNLAIKEFKHAMVAHKRRHKARQEEKGNFLLQKTVSRYLTDYIFLSRGKEVHKDLPVLISVLAKYKAS
jgi:hypothetical protein